MSEELGVLLDVTGRLERLNLAYMISGSLALSYYAPPRMTRDFDFVVRLEQDRVGRFVEAFRDDYWLDAQAVGRAAAERGAFSLIHYDAVLKIDMFVERQTDHRRVEFLRRRRVEIGGAAVWIAAPEDLVLSKLDGMRDERVPQHVEDVRSLLSTVPALDRGYVEEWAGRLGLRQVLDEALP
jgi:hypothetical protein